MKPDDTIEIRDEHDKVTWRGPWSEFAHDNETEIVAHVEAALDRGETYEAGGGAAEYFCVVVPPD
jgi:hypothetical protein